MCGTRALDVSATRGAPLGMKQEKAPRMLDFHECASTKDALRRRRSARDRPTVTMYASSSRCSSLSSPSRGTRRVTQPAGSAPHGSTSRVRIDYQASACAFWVERVEAERAQRDEWAQIGARQPRRVRADPGRAQPEQKAPPASTRVRELPRETVPVTHARRECLYDRAREVMNALRAHDRRGYTVDIWDAAVELVDAL